MQLQEKKRKAPLDYLGIYEKALRDVVEACGSREAANEMLSKIETVYEECEEEIRKLDAAYGRNPEEHAKKKAVILARKKEEVERIIGRYVPQTTEYVKELILGASLAATALILPLSYALSTLTVATGIVAIGSSYYISFKLLKNWRAISGKEKIVSHLERASAFEKRKGRDLGRTIPRKK